MAARAVAAPGSCGLGAVATDADEAGDALVHAPIARRSTARRFTI